MNISDIDKNFRISADFDTSGFDIYDINQNPFEINGLILPHGDEGIYRRMPKKVAEKVEEKAIAEGVEAAGEIEAVADM